MVTINKKIKTMMFSIAFYFAVFLLTTISPAQVSTNLIDFGDVIVESSKTIDLQIKNINTTRPLSLRLILQGNDCMSLFINSQPIPNLYITYLPPGQSIDISIRFLPRTEGYYLSTLTVYYGSSAPEQVILKGTGIEPDEPEIQDLLTLFDDYVQDGRLEGEGPVQGKSSNNGLRASGQGKASNNRLRASGQGKAADNRLRAFRNMIENAASLVDNGDIEEACCQLKSLYSKIGKFVTGEQEALQDLGDMIIEIMEHLNCD